MEGQSLEETGPDVGSEEKTSISEAVDALETNEPIKADDEAEVEETKQARDEEDEVDIQNAPENVLEDSGVEDLPGSGDVEECDAKDDGEIFPNKEEEEEKEEEKEEEPEIQVEEDHRECTDNLLLDPKVDSEEDQQLLQVLQTEHEKLSHVNNQLQKKLAEYFWLKSDGEPQAVQEIPPKQECSEKYPDILEDVKRQKQDKLRDLRRQSEEKLEQIERESRMLATIKREAIVTNLEQVMGKVEAQAAVENLLAAAQKCEDELVSVRNENIRLKLKLEAGLHVREKGRDEEMHRIDFVQLNIENQACNARVQECKEDLLKLKKMLPHTGQILMHVKEKLRFLEVENEAKQVRFDELDASVLREQEALIQTMKARDILRFDNQRKRQESGLLANPTLLRELENIEDEREALERRVEMLKRN
ncbi:coiled-coil domain-containing protein 96 [Silurus asotus]|uniref:Coiled-coil domain-containing protein 96 n=1 Tax=Silurus asotus TaxID=30991 RepID=A0AAD5FEX7_SILAS|nr:coiled-coil domain-containing protein 96 [Silurus asotus]